MGSISRNGRNAGCMQWRVPPSEGAFLRARISAFSDARPTSGYSNVPGFVSIPRNEIAFSRAKTLLSFHLGDARVRSHSNQASDPVTKRLGPRLSPTCNVVGVV